MGNRSKRRRRQQRSAKKKNPPTPQNHLPLDDGGVDVVIPVFGQLDRLERCLFCLDRSVGEIPLNVILVDDQGQPPVKSLDFSCFENLGRIRVVVNKENLGFGGSINRGARLGSRRLMLLLNSDVELEPEALSHMVKEFELPKTGIVGIKLIFPPDSRDPRRPAGRVQHAGISMNFEGRPFHIHLGWSPSHPRVNRRLELQAVTGACMMVRRDVWNRAGGFDPVYRRGTFEDIEFCLMAKNLGFNIIYQPKAAATHYVGASAETTSSGFPVQQNFMVWTLRCSEMAVWDEWRFW